MPRTGIILTALLLAGLSGTMAAQDADVLPAPQGASLDVRSRLTTVTVEVNPDWFVPRSAYAIYIRIKSINRYGVKHLLGQGRVPVSLLTLIETPDNPSTTELDYTVITGKAPPTIMSANEVEVCAQLIHYRGHELIKAETELNCATLTPAPE